MLRLKQARQPDLLNEFNSFRRQVKKHYGQEDDLFSPSAQRQASKDQLSTIHSQASISSSSNKYRNFKEKIRTQQQIVKQFMSRDTRNMESILGKLSPDRDDPSNIFKSNNQNYQIYHKKSSSQDLKQMLVRNTSPDQDNGKTRNITDRIMNHKQLTKLQQDIEDIEDIKEVPIPYQDTLLAIAKQIQLKFR